MLVLGECTVMLLEEYVVGKHRIAMACTKVFRNQYIKQCCQIHSPYAVVTKCVGGCIDKGGMTTCQGRSVGPPPENFTIFLWQIYTF